MSGDDQRQHLVDHLFVAHRFVGIAVAGGHEHGQKVEMQFRFASSTFNQLRHQLRQRAKAKGKFQVAVGFLRDHLEWIGPELFLQAVEIRTEDRAEHDRKRQLADIVGQIDGLAPAPPWPPSARQIAG